MLFEPAAYQSKIVGQWLVSPPVLCIWGRRFLQISPRKLWRRFMNQHQQRDSRIIPGNIAEWGEIMVLNAGIKIHFREYLSLGLPRSR